MAAETVRLTGSASGSSTPCNFNGSQRRPTHFLGLPSSRASISISSSLSHFLGSSARIASHSSKLSTSRQLRERRRNFSVFAMAADGLFLFQFLLSEFLCFGVSLVLCSGCFLALWRKPSVKYLFFVCVWWNRACLFCFRYIFGNGIWDRELLLFCSFAFSIF